MPDMVYIPGLDVKKWRSIEDFMYSFSTKNFGQLVHPLHVSIMTRS
jgi:hypothetical protein